MALKYTNKTGKPATGFLAWLIGTQDVGEAEQHRTIVGLQKYHLHMLEFLLDEV